MNYWILQYSPRLLRHGYPHPSNILLSRDYWNISRYASDVRVDDIAFIWHAGSPERRGIYNVATIVSVPQHTPDSQRQIELLQQSDARYWTDTQKRDELRHEPAILIERQYQNDLQPPILVRQLIQQGFGNLPIIRMPQRGIYKLDDAEGQRLLNYVRRTR